jgi:hypothetical protein
MGLTHIAESNGLRSPPAWDAGNRSAHPKRCAMARRRPAMMAARGSRRLSINILKQKEFSFFPSAHERLWKSFSFYHAAFVNRGIMYFTTAEAF